MPRGGPRPNAPGRPTVPDEKKRVKANFVLSPDTLEWIRSEAKARRVGQGRVVDELVEAMKNIIADYDKEVKNA